MFLEKFPFFFFSLEREFLKYLPIKLNEDINSNLSQFSCVDVVLLYIYPTQLNNDTTRFISTMLLCGFDLILHIYHLVVFNYPYL